MKLFFGRLAAIALLSASFSAASKEPDAPALRKPFTLTLHIDAEHYYEDELAAIPYVADRDIYLLKGDRFGITFGPDGTPHYAPDLQGADLELAFSQEVRDDGTAMMLLTLSNRTKKTVRFEGLMTVPGRKGIYETSLLPVNPGLTNYESWPHPIVQLVLRNPQLQ